VRLRTLLALRWVAVGGQSAAVIAAQQVFGLDMPMDALFIAIALSALVNLMACGTCTRRTSG
jgi:two-component system, sensor histidine kinase RegB